MLYQIERREEARIAQEVGFDERDGHDAFAPTNPLQVAAGTYFDTAALNSGLAGA